MNKTGRRKPLQLKWFWLSCFHFLFWVHLTLCSWKPCCFFLENIFLYTFFERLDLIDFLKRKLPSLYFIFCMTSLWCTWLLPYQFSIKYIRINSEISAKVGQENIKVEIIGDHLQKVNVWFKLCLFFFVYSIFFGLLPCFCLFSRF